MAIGEQRGYSVQEPEHLLNLNMRDDPRLFHLGHTCPGKFRRIFLNKV